MLLWSSYTNSWLRSMACKRWSSETSRGSSCFYQVMLGVQKSLSFLHAELGTLRLDNGLERFVSMSIHILCFLCFCTTDCLNCLVQDSLRTGSALQYIEWAHQRNIAVLILNPNSPASRKINFSYESRTDHILRAWDTICRKLPAKKIAIVAHSCGGYDACELLKHRESELLGRLKCVAFSDAGQASYVKDVPVAARTFLVENGVEWAASNEPLGTLLKANTRKTGRRSNWLCMGVSSRVAEFRCMEISAGTASHGETTSVAFPAISQFILSKFLGQQPGSKLNRNQHGKNVHQL